MSHAIIQKPWTVLYWPSWWHLKMDQMPYISHNCDSNPSSALWPTLHNYWPPSLKTYNYNAVHIMSLTVTAGSIFKHLLVCAQNTCSSCYWIIINSALIFLPKSSGNYCPVFLVTLCYPVCCCGGHLNFTFLHDLPQVKARECCHSVKNLSSYLLPKNLKIKILLYFTSHFVCVWNSVSRTKVGT
jgi:hypothetical protein